MTDGLINQNKNHWVEPPKWLQNDDCLILSNYRNGYVSVWENNCYIFLLQIDKRKNIIQQLQNPTEM